MLKFYDKVLSFKCRLKHSVASRTCSQLLLKRLDWEREGREDQLGIGGRRIPFKRPYSSANKRCIDIVRDKTLPLKRSRSWCLGLRIPFRSCLNRSKELLQLVISGENFFSSQSLEPMHCPYCWNYAHRQDAANCSIREAPRCIFAHLKLELSSLAWGSECFQFIWFYRDGQKRLS